MYAIIRLLMVGVLNGNLLWNMRLFGFGIRVLAWVVVNCMDLGLLSFADWFGFISFDGFVCGLGEFYWT